MPVWPVPNSFSKILPSPGTAGSFWEDRKDRHHCGVDIYAALNSPVLATEGGRVIETGIFTSPALVPYWYVTHYIILQSDSGFVCKFAEISDIQVSEGDQVQAGEFIGRVAHVLNLKRIDETSPEYIKRLQKNNTSSMLHFELYRTWPVHLSKYVGGNSFSQEKPSDLLDPTDYLTKAVINKDFS